MDSQTIETVTDLIDLMNKTDPLSKKEQDRLYQSHRESQKIDFLAPESVQQAQVKAIEKRQLERKESVLNNLWQKSLVKDNQDDLRLHAALTIEFFKEYLKTGEAPPPASPLLVAILLKKRRDKELERQFLASWSRHFCGAIGTGYQKLDARYEKLRP